MVQTCKCDILIVDNASADNTGAWCKNIKSDYAPPTFNGEVHYFNTGRNIGGAGGFNYGMRKAVEMGYEYVWIMDDDCIPNPDSLEKLMEADEILGGHDKYGYLSSAVLWTDRTECKIKTGVKVL